METSRSNGAILWMFSRAANSFVISLYEQDFMYGCQRVVHPMELKQHSIKKYQIMQLDIFLGLKLSKMMLSFHRITQ